MSMDGNGLSVADALALGRDGNGMFGDGNGSWIFFLFFSLPGVEISETGVVMV